MTPDQVVKFYDGSQRRAAAALGLSFQAVSAWVTRGYVPWERQLDIDFVTGGALEARLDDVPPERRPARIRPGTGARRARLAAAAAAPVPEPRAAAGSHRR